jgi:hypothetical protein
LKRIVLAGLICLLSLTACGGGGSSSSSDSALPAVVSSNSTSATNYPLQKAFLNYLGTNNTYNISTNYQGHTIAESVSITKQPQITIGTLKLNASVESAIVKLDGALDAQSSVIYLTDPTTGYFYGIASPASGYDFVGTSGGYLPATATIGSSGKFISGNVVNNNTNLTVGTESIGYEVDTDPSNANHALFCLDTTATTTTATGKECLRIDAQGNLYGAIVSATVDGQTLTLQKFLKQAN